MSIKWLIVPSIVLAFASESRALSVPADECPGSPSGYFDNCCTWDLTCDRTDGAPQITVTGTPGTHMGSTMNCDNCSGCPGSPPPPQNCIQTLSVTYAETITFSIAAGVSGGIGFEASLQNEIGVDSQTAFSGQVSCGSGAFTACKKGYPAYGANVSIIIGKTAKIDRTYSWRKTVTGNAWTCSCSNLVGYSVSGMSGVRTSTATGNCVDGSAGCRTLSVVDCT